MRFYETPRYVRFSIPVRHYFTFKYSTHHTVSRHPQYSFFFTAKEKVEEKNYINIVMKYASLDALYACIYQIGRVSLAEQGWSNTVQVFGREYCRRI